MPHCIDVYSINAFNENLRMHNGNLYKLLPEINTMHSSYIFSESSTYLPIYEDKDLYTMGGFDGGNKIISILFRRT